MGKPASKIVTGGALRAILGLHDSVVLLAGGCWLRCRCWRGLHGRGRCGFGGRFGCGLRSGFCRCRLCRRFKGKFINIGRRQMAADQQAGQRNYCFHDDAPVQSWADYILRIFWHGSATGEFRLLRNREATGGLTPATSNVFWVTEAPVRSCLSAHKREASSRRQIVEKGVSPPISMSTSE